MLLLLLLLLGMDALAAHKVRDLEWMNASNAVAAVGSSLVLLHLQSHAHEERLACDVVKLPDFHSDTIRELKANPNNPVRRRVLPSCRAAVLPCCRAAVLPCCISIARHIFVKRRRCIAELLLVCAMDIFRCR